jgi:hypothetical protein
LEGEVKGEYHAYLHRTSSRQGDFLKVRIIKAHRSKVFEFLHERERERESPEISESTVHKGYGRRGHLAVLGG